MKQVKNIILLLFAVTIIYMGKVEASPVVKAYTYNQDPKANNYCITGTETTCKETSCYIKNSEAKCAAGTIIDYKVNDQETVRFYVMFDENNILTMQSQRNTIYNSVWYGTSTASNDSTHGPLTILPALEQKTVGWTNVKDQSYTMGTTVFKTNKWTGCPASNGIQPTCNTNTYTLPSRTAKARMITVQEAVLFGCYFKKIKTCPVWLYNYLARSASYGGTSNDSAADDAYWTMNAYNYTIAYDMFTEGDIDYNYTWGWEGPAAHGARAVVEINKVVKDEAPGKDSVINIPVKESKSGNQVVDVKDTLKVAYIGYCLGAILLILGIMVLYQTYRKSKS